jgi:hypothetical protein
MGLVHQSPPFLQTLHPRDLQEVALTRNQILHGLMVWIHLLL